MNDIRHYQVNITLVRQHALRYSLHHWHYKTMPAPRMVRALPSYRSLTSEQYTRVGISYKSW